MSNINHSFDTGQHAEEDMAQLTRSAIKALFERYPNISGDERREMARYLNSGPLMDIGLLKGDETVRYKIAAFEKDNEKALSTTTFEAFVLIGIFALTALICYVMWDMGL